MGDFLEQKKFMQMIAHSKELVELSWMTAKST